MTTSFFFEQFRIDEGRRGDLENAAEVMRRIGVPALLGEMGGDIAATVSPDGAFRDAFHQGYRRAVRDIFFFKEIYVDKSKERPPVNFSPIDELIKDKTITPSEAQELKRRKNGG